MIQVFENLILNAAESFKSNDKPYVRISTKFDYSHTIKIPNVSSINFELKYNWYYAFLLAILILFSIINLNKQVSFIYFQF